MLSGPVPAEWGNRSSSSWRPAGRAPSPASRAHCRDGSPGPSLPRRHPCAVLNTEPVNLPARYAHSDTPRGTQDPSPPTGPGTRASGEVRTQAAGACTRLSLRSFLPSPLPSSAPLCPAAANARPLRGPSRARTWGGYRVCPVSKPTGCAAGEASPSGQMSSIPLILSTPKPHTGPA